MRTKQRIGVLGGSGLYSMAGLDAHDEIALETPYGAPSDRYALGEVDGTPVAFLARHGRGHRFPPSEVPYRANLYGFRLLGVSNLLSVSAVGSLKDDIEPCDLVVPDQFIDRTTRRVATFSEPGAVIHAAMADPVCSRLSALLAESARAQGATVHAGGTYLCIEGPQFSTRAESELYRNWGADVIGMTNATEAKLAREAGIAYATLAMACDYDCWHPTHESVTAEMAIANLMASVDVAQSVLRHAIASLPADTPASCGDASRALISPPDAVPPEARRRLAALIPSLAEASKESE
ncbi:MAG: S-methyl-5'-thioadenosine phosphorylase [Acidobacteria bacterium]|nr:S-methyl-5'-thioadenosine phosphorylase [Acidobacteriota bacterium]